MKSPVLLTALLATLAIGVAGCAHRAEKAAVAAEPAPVAVYTAPSAPAPAPIAAAPAPVETQVAQAPSASMGAAPAEPAPKADRN